MTIVKDITKIIENFAPINLKEDFDNVGLMVGSYNKEVKKVLLALDCTNKVIEEGKFLGVDLIITHHPLIFMKPSRIIEEDFQGGKIIELIKNDISLYACHTNLDSCRNGINEEIINLLGFGDGKLIEVNKNSVNGNEGIGRVVKLLSPIDIQEVISKVKKVLNISSMKVVKGKEKVSSIAVINGSGQSFISRAVSMGADCIITGDTSYHAASDYKEQNISIIDAGHFSTEWLVYLKVMEEIKKSCTNIEFIESKVCEDPYEYV